MMAPREADDATPAAQQRRRSSTATHRLSTLFRRGSQAVNTDFVAELIDDVSDDDAVADCGDILEGLSLRSSELASLSDGDMVRLGEDLLSAIRSDGWSTAGDWVAKEMQLLKLITGETGGHNDQEVDPKVRSVASMTRLQMGTIAASFTSSFIRGLKIKDEKMGNLPELLQKKEKYHTKNEEVMEVHGPVGMGANLPGHSFEVWTANPQESGPVADRTVSKNEAGVTVVLGAGNQSFLTLTDILQQCLVHRRTVLIKHHPLRPYLMKPFSVILEPLIRRGFLSQVKDRGIPYTTAILANALVTHVHLTGSLATDKAVKETLRRSRPNATRAYVDGMVTSELGCATPFIVSPGAYSSAELENAAKVAVASKKANGGCNCLCTQVIVLPRDWSQKEAFRRELVKAIQECATFPVYYPGSIDRKKEFVEHYSALGDGRSKMIKGATAIGCCTDDDDLVLLECGTPGEDGYDDLALMKEAFGPVLALVELPGGDCDGNNYLQSTAIPFVNDKTSIFGSLSCHLAVPGDMDQGAIKEAVACINYGNVAVNTWAVGGYMAAMSGGFWGAHPLDATGQSGKGLVGNLYGMQNQLKTVLYGPSLAKSPVFDVKPPPPAIVFDAIYALTSKASIATGLFQVWKVLVFRAMQSFLPGFVLPKSSKGQSRTYPYGSAF